MIPEMDKPNANPTTSKTLPEKSGILTQKY